LKNLFNTTNQEYVAIHDAIPKNQGADDCGSVAASLLIARVVACGGNARGNFAKRFFASVYRGKSRPRVANRKRKRAEASGMTAWRMLACGAVLRAQAKRQSQKLFADGAAVGDVPASASDAGKRTITQNTATGFKEGKPNGSHRRALGKEEESYGLVLGHHPN